MNDRSKHAPTQTGNCPDIVITPEPTDEELAAIVAAVTTWSQASVQPDALDMPSRGQTARWARAGRREAMRGLARDDERPAR